MGAKPGRDTLIRNVSVNENELECFRRLIDHGIQIVYQLVPVEKEIDIKNAIERKQK
jgi:PTS system sorbose subfamily IIB component.